MRAIALAGVASLVLLAAEVHAAALSLVLDPNLSSITQQWTMYGPALGSPQTSTAQYAGAETTTYSGQLSIDLQPGTIQLLTGATISAAIGAPGDGGTPGRYAPHDPVSSDPLSPPNAGFQDNSNYGLAIAGGGQLGLLATLYDLEIDFGLPALFIFSTPTPLAGTIFNLLGQAMQYTNGRQAVVSVLGNATSSMVGEPAAIFGIGGADIGIWDGTTLTIPIHSRYTLNVTTDFGGIDRDVFATGVLVAHLVPEPSTLVLLGFGIVGIAGRARAARRRAGT